MAVGVYSWVDIMTMSKFSSSHSNRYAAALQRLAQQGQICHWLEALSSTQYEYLVWNKHVRRNGRNTKQSKRFAAPLHFSRRLHRLCLSLLFLRLPKRCTATALACQQMLKGDPAPKHANHEVCKLLGRQRSGQSLPQGHMLSLPSTRLWSFLLGLLRQEQRADCVPY